MYPMVDVHVAFCFLLKIKCGRTMKVKRDGIRKERNEGEKEVVV